MQKVDDLDFKLLIELKKDSQISIPSLSKKLGINSSVLYSRINRLVKKKIITKFTIETDDSRLGIGVKALCPAQYGRHSFICRANNIIVRILFCQRDTGRLTMGAQH